MQSTSTPMNAKGQGHLVTLAKCHMLNIFKPCFLKTTAQIEIIFNSKPMRDSRNKLYSNNLGHLTKTAFVPKYGKKKKKKKKKIFFSRTTRSIALKLKM